MESPAFGDPPSGDTASLPSQSCRDAGKRRVTYFYAPDIGNFYFGRNHPMKPLRITMAHNLVVKYGLTGHLTVDKPFPARPKDLLQFHSQEYVDFLKHATPQKFLAEKYDVDEMEDCPVFYDMFDFCTISTGGSIGAAVRLNHGEADIAINWAGGLHHAHKDKASGFCYINDIVLGIMELLNHHDRVLYVDIDVHHGDGVQEAFKYSNKVMTVSFHKKGVDFFPYNNEKHIDKVGEDEGRYYNINVPLDDGMDDQSFQGLFKPIIEKVMQVFQPHAVVLQCGADSLSGDKLGCFNLTLKGHGECLRFLRSFNVPLMVLGGGGYTISNVARCWCYETAVALGVELDDNLPANDFGEFYGPEYKLHIKPSNMQNKNSVKTLEKTRLTILNRLSKIEPVPSSQFRERPPDVEVPEQEDEDMDTRPEPVLFDDRCVGSYSHGHDITNERTKIVEDTMQ